ncbi:MAG TPA: sugar phosphate nucleotidyltransferase [Candidatus Kapabacteria bacterium]|nr:sugar phosphate nucleotidyltransferase [Candidatus Kapabacteria bacterium]
MTELSTAEASRPLATVILAAGQGKRMQDPSLAKVLYPIGGEPMLGHVLRLCQHIEAAPIICIIGYGREAVAAYISEQFPRVRTAIQEEQLGTGHAVQQAERQLRDFSGDVLVLSGDVPLLTRTTTLKLLAEHRARSACATVLSVIMPNPTGYGRIVRTPSGSLEKIVEEKDATTEQKRIAEINTGIYVFDANVLFDVLKRIDRKNAQGEFYLTDTFALLIAQFGLGAVAVVTTNDPTEVSGVNTKEQLAALEAEYRRRNALARK